MKVRIDTPAAARLFSCAIGEFRDLQKRDAAALIDSRDVSEVAAKVARKAPAKRKAR